MSLAMWAIVLSVFATVVNALNIFFMVRLNRMRRERDA